MRSPNLLEKELVLLTIFVIRNPIFSKTTEHTTSGSTMRLASRKSESLPTKSKRSPTKYFTCIRRPRLSAILIIWFWRHSPFIWHQRLIISFCGTRVSRNTTTKTRKNSKKPSTRRLYKKSSRTKMSAFRQSVKLNLRKWRPRRSWWRGSLRISRRHKILGMWNRRVLPRRLRSSR